MLSPPKLVLGDVPPTGGGPPPSGVTPGREGQGFGIRPKGAEVRMRHPHPTEATLINGCIPNHMWPGSLRLWLSAIGQLAAPFHALWVAGQVRVHIEKLHMGDSSFDLSNAMSLHAQKLLEISHQLFATPAVPALSLNDVECDARPTRTRHR